MKILFTLLLTFTISAPVFATDLLTNKDCKNLEKIMASTLELQGLSKEDIKIGKQLIRETCKEAVKQGLTKEQYSILMQEIFSQL